MALFKPLVGSNNNIGKVAQTAGQMLMTYEGYLYFDVQNPANNVVTRHMINPDLPNMSGILTIAKGGTGATTAEGARTNLGLGSAAVASILATSSTIANNTSSNGLVSAAQVVNYVTSQGYKTTDNDTKNTAGATNTSSKIFIIGATSQETNPQTYSQDTAYVDTDGHLYSNSKQVVNLSDSQNLTNKTYNGLTLTANTTGFSIKGGSTTAHTLTVQSDITLAAAAGKDVVTDITNNTTSSNLPTAAAVATYVTNSFSANDAMRFKGTVSSSTGNGTLKSWPPTSYEKGDTYKVAEAGTYSGQDCEIGDMLIAINDYNATSASNVDWTAVQNNITVATNSSTKGYAAYYSSSNAISGINLTTNDVTASGNTTVAVTSVTQDASGKITVKKATVSGTTPSAHTHGNITNDGKIGAVADLAVITTTGGTLTTEDLTVSNPTASGVSLAFIDTISQNSKGKITVTKKTVSTMGNATSDAAGAAGLVPAPGKGQQGYVLTGSGWQQAYSHPTYTSYTSGLYKITVDNLGHVSGATAVTKTDITALGIPSTNTTYSADNSTISLSGTTFSMKAMFSASNSYGPSTDVTLSTTSEGKFSVPYFTVDTYGRITAASTKTITMDAIVWGTF